MEYKCNNGEVCLPKSKDLKNTGYYVCRNFSRENFDVTTSEKSKYQSMVLISVYTIQSFHYL